MCLNLDKKTLVLAKNIACQLRVSFFPCISKFEILHCFNEQLFNKKINA